MQLGVAGGDSTRSATGAHPGARPAYPVCERVAILKRPHLVGDHLIVVMPCREGGCMLFIIAVEVAAAKPWVDDTGITGFSRPAAA